jgi:hypothetical protein
MWASPFQRLLYNLRQELPETSWFYLPREEAYKQLCEMTGQDFGYDGDGWEKWGRAHDLFYPGT